MGDPVTVQRDRPWLSDGLSDAIKKVIVGVSLFLLVCLVGMLGYIVAGWAVGDAIYMVVITIFGVGYGEVQPVESAALRAFTIGVIITGYGSVIYAVGGFIQLLIDGEFNKMLGERRMTKEIDQIANHTIICGFGRMGSILAHDLEQAGQPFVAIDSNESRAQAARGHGYLVVTGDATEEEVLEQAGIERATVLASVLGEDAANVFVTLTGRALRSDLSIIARGESPATEDKLQKCGADQVIMPTAIGATKVSQWILRPSADELLDHLAQHGPAGLDLSQIGVELDEVTIDASSALVGKTLDHLDVGGNLGYLILGIRKPGAAIELHPAPDTILEVGDQLLLLGHQPDLPKIASQLSGTSATVTYRGATMESR